MTRVALGLFLIAHGLLHGGHLHDAAAKGQGGAIRPLILLGSDRRPRRRRLGPPAQSVDGIDNCRSSHFGWDLTACRLGSLGSCRGPGGCHRPSS